MGTNTLAIVGSGIKFMSHLTIEAKACIEKASKVLYLLNEPAIEEWIKKTNKNTESLDQLYFKHNIRNDNYTAIANYIISQLNNYAFLCVVMYGHPTTLAQPVIYALDEAKSLGFQTIVLPGISAEACMHSDLQIDPTAIGCQSFEATDFLLYQREYDCCSHLVLWQPYVIGLLQQPINHDPRTGLELLTEHLKTKYHSNHSIILYECAQYPAFKPRIDNIYLESLPEAQISDITTLYIPPKDKKNINEVILKKLQQMF